MRPSTVSVACLFVATMWGSDRDVHVSNLAMLGPDSREEDNVSVTFRDPGGHVIYLFAADDGALAYSFDRSIAQRAIADRAPYGTAVYHQPADVAYYVSSPSRRERLEDLATAVRENISGLPDHPWIPGAGCRPVRDALLALDGALPEHDRS